MNISISGLGDIENWKNLSVDYAARQTKNVSALCHQYLHILV